MPERGSLHAGSPGIREERGALLVHVAVAMIGLLACSALAVDFGLRWAARTQAQNAADAGALAGATALSFDDFNDRSDAGMAKQSALQYARANQVWGQVPSVNAATDVTFPPCPDGTNACVRVDVYRNQARNNPLPTFFANIVGVASQGVRATATAQSAAGNASDCLKPWGVADKWAENNPVPNSPWTSTATFDPTGATPDVYVPPNPATNNPGTGFRVPDDIGTELRLKVGSPTSAVNPGWFQPLDLCPGGCGGDGYRDNIAGCVGAVWGIGDGVPKENGNMVGPTGLGTRDLIALDPRARWDAATQSVVDSCVGPPYTCAQPGYAQSPRIVAIPVFDLDLYMQTGGPGNGTVRIVNILGFFVADVGPPQNTVRGYLVTKPDLLAANKGTPTQSASFVRFVRLIR